MGEQGMRQLPAPLNALDTRPRGSESVTTTWRACAVHPRSRAGTAAIVPLERRASLPGGPQGLPARSAAAVTRKGRREAP